MRRKKNKENWLLVTGFWYPEYLLFSKSGYFPDTLTSGIIIRIYNITSGIITQIQSLIATYYLLFNYPDKIT